MGRAFVQTLLELSNFRVTKFGKSRETEIVTFLKCAEFFFAGIKAL